MGTLKETFKDVADAIREKRQITDTIKPINFAKEISKIEAGGVIPMASRTVNFYDYNGDLLANYELTNNMTLAFLPYLPDHTDIGLTSDGWNYTLEEINTTQISIDVYNMCHPTDGNTHLSVNMTSSFQSVAISYDSAYTYTIDWGDGTVDSSTKHTYVKTGEYKITITSDAPTFAMVSGKDYVQSVFLSNKITTILKNAFGSELTTLVIPNSVTNIDGQAFTSGKLTYLAIPNSITSIDDSTFDSCSKLTHVIMSNSVTSIGDSAFSGCKSLTSIVIPNSVTTIGSRAFYTCKSLTSITIPSSVTKIGSEAFYNCIHLVEVINKSPLYMSCGITSPGYVGFYAINIKTQGTSDMVRINDYLFYTYNNINYLIRYIGNNTELTLPESYNGEPYEIYNYAFYDSQITSVIIPDNVTNIGKYAFSSCPSLTDIAIGNGVTSIGDKAFSSCSSLTNVEMGNGITDIGVDIFQSCSKLQYNQYDIVYYLGNKSNPYVIAMKAQTTATSCTINEQCKVIGRSAFSGCVLTEITIPNNVTTIEINAFQGCTSLTNIVIGDSVTTIKDRAFDYCTSLTNVTIPDNIMNIGMYAFDGCSKLQYNEYNNIYYLGNENNPYVVLVQPNSTSISSCEINKQCKIIECEAFYQCRSLESIIIPDNVVAIGAYAFCRCTSLKSVAIGNSTTTIGRYAFESCDSLKTITMPSSVTDIDTCAFSNCNIQYIYYNGTVENWMNINAEDLRTRPNSSTQEIPNVCLCILDENGDVEYGDNKYSILTEVVIPEGTTTIPIQVFGNMSSITSVIIPSSVTAIEAYAFSNCRNITSITIPNSVIYIGNSAFSNCLNITSITIPNSVIYIGNSAFSNCFNITSITIPNSVIYIGDSAFSSNCGITSAVIQAINPPEIKSTTFTTKIEFIYVPAIAVNNYKKASGWSSYASKIQAISE